MSLFISKLKVFALNWAINRCHSQLGLTPQHLSIEVTNRILASNECGLHEKKIVIADNKIVTYEHYSEPGNPFLSRKYDDFFRFLRSWFAPDISWMVEGWLIANPEYNNSHEMAKASGNWVNHFLWSNKKRTELIDAIYWELDNSMNAFPMRFVKLLIFGRYKYSYKTLGQELVGEWVTQDEAKLRYVFRQDGFTRYDDDQPKQFSYKIQTIRNRHLSLETTYLPNNSADTATLYFFDDCKSLEYRSGRYNVIWHRSDNLPNS